MCGSNTHVLSTAFYLVQSRYLPLLITYSKCLFQFSFVFRRTSKYFDLFDRLLALLEFIVNFFRLEHHDIRLRVCCISSKAFAGKFPEVFTIILKAEL